MVQLLLLPQLLMTMMMSISLDPGIVCQNFSRYPYVQWIVGILTCCSDEEESEEKKRITEERLKAYHEKKSQKKAVIAKTSVLLDVKVG